jgi:hypothetical protein
MWRLNNSFGVKNFLEMSRRFICLRFLLFLLVLMCVWACEDDPKFNAASVEGRWEITRGLRNGQETGTLSGTYFRFGADGKMITNLPVGPEVSVDYEIVKSTIFQKSAAPIEYAIRSLSDSAMVLGFELRGMQFEIYLQRKEAEVPAPEVPFPDEPDTPDTMPTDGSSEE